MIFKKITLLNLAIDNLKFILISILPKIAGLLKDILIVNLFFNGGSLDDYLAIFALCLMPYSFVSSSIESVVIKKYAEKEINIADIYKIYWIFIITTVIFWFLFLNFYYFKANDININFLNLIFIVIYYVVSGLQKMYYSILQATNKLNTNFIVPIVGPIITSIVIILDSNIYSLYLSLALSSIAELYILYLSCNKIFESKTNNNASAINIYYDIIKIGTASFIPSLTPLFEVSKLKSFDDLDLSLFSMAYRFPSAFGAVILTVISVSSYRSYVNIADYEKLRELSHRYFFLTVLIGVLFIFSFYISSEYIIYIFYKSSINQSQYEVLSELCFFLSIELAFNIISMNLWRLLLAKFVCSWVLMLPNIISCFQILMIINSPENLIKYAFFSKIIPSMFGVFVYLIAYIKIKKELYKCA